MNVILGVVVSAFLLFVYVSATSPPIFTFKDGNKTCVLLQGDISLDLTYKNNGSEGHMNSTVPADATTEGKCEKKVDQLSINWFANAPGDYDFTMTLYFNHTSTDQFKLGNMSLKGDISKDDVKIDVSDSFHNFVADVGKSYNCTKKTELQISAGDVKAKFTFKNLRVEAFKNDTSGKNATFSAVGNDCSPPTKLTDAIVPIAVGAALAGMVVIVLIGYCIGRRRTRAGYQNMNA